MMQTWRFVIKAVTLRGIPPGVARALRKRSEGRSESLNKAVLALLEEAVGSRKPRRKKLHHDLDALAGSWARDEGAAFERSLAEQRRIDPELWR